MVSAHAYPTFNLTESTQEKNVDICSVLKSILFRLEICYHYKTNIKCKHSTYFTKNQVFQIFLQYLITEVKERLMYTVTGTVSMIVKTVQLQNDSVLEV